MRDAGFAGRDEGRGTRDEACMFSSLIPRPFFFRAGRNFGCLCPTNDERAEETYLMKPDRSEYRPVHFGSRGSVAVFATWIEGGGDQFGTEARAPGTVSALRFALLSPRHVTQGG